MLLGMEKEKLKPSLKLIENEKFEAQHEFPNSVESECLTSELMLYDHIDQTTKTPLYI